MNIDAKGKELTVGLGYEKPKENESPIEWPAGIYVSGGKSITIDAKRVRLYNAYGGKMYGGDIYFDSKDSDRKLTITGDLDLTGERNGRVELDDGELKIGGNYKGGHIANNTSAWYGKIVIGGNADIQESNSRNLRRRYKPVGLEARDISVGGNVNIKLNSESYDSVPDWDSYDRAIGIECRGKFQIGGNIVMRNQDADHPWGIYVPYLKNPIFSTDGSMGIHYSGYDGGLIKGDLDLMLRTRTGILVDPEWYKHDGNRGKFYLAGNVKIEMYPYLRVYESIHPYAPLIAIYNNSHMDVAVNMGQDGKQPGNKNVQIDGNIKLFGASLANNTSGAEYSFYYL